MRIVPPAVVEATAGRSVDPHGRPSGVGGGRTVGAQLHSRGIADSTGKPRECRRTVITL